MSSESTSRFSRKYFRNLSVFTLRVILIAVVLLYFGLPTFQVLSAMHPRRIPVGDVSPADLDLDYREITLITEDNLQLKGWYIPSENRAAVILIHAYNGNRTGMIYHAELLSQRGYGVLLYDTRTQGESDGDLYRLGWEDYLDVLAAVDHLNAQPDVDAERIAVLGLSAGAKGALSAATKSESIAAVIVEGTRWNTFEGYLNAMEPKWYIWVPADWLAYQIGEWIAGIESPAPIYEALAQMSTPLLLITADAERISSQVYYDAARGPKEIWVRNEPGHQIDALFDEPEEYERRVIGFLNRVLQIQTE